MQLCPFNFNTIKCGKISVKHNLLPSDYLYQRLYFVRENQLVTI